MLRTAGATVVFVVLIACGSNSDGASSGVLSDAEPLTHPLPGTLAAQERLSSLEQIEELKHASTLGCHFDREGQTFEWRDGQARGVRADSEKVPVMFDQIDRRSGQARRIVATESLQGEHWIENVAIFEFGWEMRNEAAATYGITFVAGVGEYRHAPIGQVGRMTGVSMTTVWSTVDPHSVVSSAWEYPAVFSDHTVQFANDLPAQYPGRCWIER